MHNQKILSVGSHPATRQPGGVITHMRLLAGVEALQGLEPYDVGSIHGTAALSDRWALLIVLRNVWRLRRKLIRKRYDILMLHHAIMPASLLKLALILMTIPGSMRDRTLVFFHGGRFERIPFLRRPAGRLAMHAAFRRAKRFFFLSDAERTGFSFYFPRLPFAMFRNFSDSNEIVERPARKEGPVRLLFVGRVAAVKGIFEVLDAMELLHLQGLDFELTVVGSGPDLPSAIEKVNAAPFGHRVAFPGYLAGSDLEQVYRWADILLFPTMHPEGFPYVLIEAMRSGLPLVATTEGVLESFVLDDETGFRVPPSDAGAVADAVVRLSDRKVLDRISTNVYQRFKKDLAKNWAEEYYRDLVAEFAVSPEQSA